MPYYHPEIQYTFLATPRTGSRAARDALCKIGFEKVGPHHGGIDHIERPVMSCATVIRDPAEILASWVRRNTKPDLSPREIVRHECKTNEWVARGGLASLHIEEASEILRYEQGLSKGLKEWLSNTGLYVNDVPRRSVTGGHLTAEQKEIIKNITRKERIKLGYE